MLQHAFAPALISLDAAISSNEWSCCNMSSMREAFPNNKPSATVRFWMKAATKTNATRNSRGKVIKSWNRNTLGWSVMSPKPIRERKVSWQWSALRANRARAVVSKEEEQAGGTHLSWLMRCKQTSTQRINQRNHRLSVHDTIGLGCRKEKESVHFFSPPISNIKAWCFLNITYLWYMQLVSSIRNKRSPKRLLKSMALWKRVDWSLPACRWIYR